MLKPQFFPVSQPRWMSRAVLISLIAISFQTNASVHGPLELESTPCGDKALMLLQEWGAQDEWLQKFSESADEKRFQAPTGTFGKWVQVKKDGKKNLVLSQFSATSTLNLKFDSQCKPVAEVQTLKDGPVKKPSKIGGVTVMNDEQIERILQNKKPAVFFLWSPHMQISIEALREIQTAAKNLGLPLYAVVEPGSNPVSVKFIAQKLAIPMKQVSFLDSFDLSLRGFRLHFPSLVVVNHGRFKSPVRRGHEPAATYEDYIRSHL